MPAQTLRKPEFNRADRPETGRPRLIICGSSSFWQEDLLVNTMDHMIQKLYDPIIVSGAQSKRIRMGGREMVVGADYLGEKWAAARWLTIKRYPAAWNRLGRRAGLYRNREMVEYVTGRRPCFCCAFWDGRSTGTADMIELCKTHDIKLRVVKYDPARPL